MDNTCRIRDGYSVCGGLLEQGWFAGVLLFEDFDSKAYAADLPADFGKRVDRWQKWHPKVAGLPRRLLRVLPTPSGLENRELASAERIDGPVCPKERVASPILAWTERRDGAWELKLFREEKTQAVIRQKGMLRSPQVASAPEGILLACERDDAGGAPEVVLLRPDGTEIFRTPGRNPGLAAVADGAVLLTEQCSPNGILLKLIRIRNGKAGGETEIRGDDYTFNADLAGSGSGDEVFVATENCPAFGNGSQFGQHRDIRIWRYAEGRLTPFPSADGQALPVEKRAFQSLGPENLPPIRPQLFVENSRPVVVFRQFRYRGFKTFGWDLFWCRPEGNAWTAPVRISPCQSLPDTGACVRPLGKDRYVGMFPALEHDGGAGRTYGHRVEFIEFDASHRLERFEIDAEKSRPYAIPRGYKDIAPEPPPLPSLYPGRTLIWGDMHVHTTYSKCVGAVDGSPAEKLQFSRDSLGCRVFTLTEHTQELSNPELAWCLDQLEKTAGDRGIVLYAAEPPFKPGRHTNVYTRDRALFERLSLIFLTHNGDRRLEYRHIREEFPQGSVFVMQHFHGDITGKDEMMASFDPQLEVAMEAMQGRCNALLETADEALPFPTGFLNRGCKLGLVGGTDHFRSGPNRFCLTGFWVREMSVDGVWEAILSRHTIAMSNARVALAATLNGQPLGRSVPLDADAPVRIRLTASCGHPIRRATLIRDGEVLPWIPIDQKSADIELTDAPPAPGPHWYVPTVETDTAFGPDTPGYAHTSPFFVMRG